MPGGSLHPYVRPRGRPQHGSEGALDPTAIPAAWAKEALKARVDTRITLTPLSTPPGTQYGATLQQGRAKETGLEMRDMQPSCNPRQHVMGSLVMSRGQRFESARRLTCLVRG